MVALASQDDEALRASDIELVTPRTVLHVGARWSASTRHGYSPSSLFFITGADAFAEIATWRRLPASSRRRSFRRRGPARAVAPTSIRGAAAGARARMRDVSPTVGEWRGDMMRSPSIFLRERADPRRVVHRDPGALCAAPADRRPGASRGRTTHRSPRALSVRDTAASHAEGARPARQACCMSKRISKRASDRIDARAARTGATAVTAAPTRRRATWWCSTCERPTPSPTIS